MTGLIPERFWQQAEVNAGRLAVVDTDSATSYGELADSARRLAATLLAAGVQPGDRVAVFIPKSADAVTAFLACLAVGAIYVPVDLSSPCLRVSRVIRRANARAVLLNSHGQARFTETAALLPDWQPVIGALDSLVTADPTFGPGEIAAAPPRPIDARVGPDAVAQLLFTSGSTGDPKGVSVTHANVRHFIDWATAHFGIQAGERLSSHPPFHFDLSTLDLYGALSAGAELHLVPPQLNLLPPKLAKFIADRELHQWVSVPTALTQLVAANAIQSGGFPALRRILWSGEAMPLPTLRTLMANLPAVRFTNLYGPTETTVASSHFTVPRSPERDAVDIPIGRALPGEELVILDDNGRPVDGGGEGELCIAGSGITSGYWEDPTRTAAAFGIHPDRGTPLYRTGDMARIDGDGLAYLLGRADQQVKIRGHRIELGEIEAALHSLDLVETGAIVAIDVAATGTKEICCAAVVAKSSGTDVIFRLRKELSQFLPRYMLPTRWRMVDALPLNSNGKADRPTLRSWFEEETRA